jgi:hypothetical protein
MKKSLVLLSLSLLVGAAAFAQTAPAPEPTKAATVTTDIKTGLMYYTDKLGDNDHALATIYDKNDAVKAFRGDLTFSYERPQFGSKVTLRAETDLDKSALRTNTVTDPNVTALPAKITAAATAVGTYAAILGAGGTPTAGQTPTADQLAIWDAIKNDAGNNVDSKRVRNYMRPTIIQAEIDQAKKLAYTPATPSLYQAYGWLKAFDQQLVIKGGLVNDDTFSTGGNDHFLTMAASKATSDGTAADCAWGTTVTFSPARTGLSLGVQLRMAEGVDASGNVAPRVETPQTALSQSTLLAKYTLDQVFAVTGGWQLASSTDDQYVAFGTQLLALPNLQFITENKVWLRSGHYNTFNQDLRYKLDDLGIRDLELRFRVYERALNGNASTYLSGNEPITNDYMSFKPEVWYMLGGVVQTTAYYYWENRQYDAGDNTWDAGLGVGIPFGTGANDYSILSLRGSVGNYASEDLLGSHDVGAIVGVSYEFKM